MTINYGPECAILIGPDYYFDEGVVTDCPTAGQLLMVDANNLQGTFLGNPMLLERNTSTGG